MTQDIVFSLDTTGSMFPCLTQVRRNVVKTVTSLFKEIKNLRIGIIAHGDYVDKPVFHKLELTKDVDEICDFVRHAPPTSGGDMDECYELILHEAQKFKWRKGTRCLVLIGDANPHPVGYRFGGNQYQLNWRDEARALVAKSVAIYPVQALGRSSANAFYQGLAEISGTPKLELPQFSDVEDILCAITYQQAGKLEQFEQTLKGRKPSQHLLRTLDQLAGRPLSNRSTKIGSRFQVLDVELNTDIKGFVQDNGLYFTKGRGFYQFTKKETIQEYKEVVAQNKETGAIVTGKVARRVLGIPEERADVKPDPDAKHIGFIQSTSVNRKLVGGTKFLYEVPEASELEV